MPYDDSNIKRMVKDQLERRVGFSKSKRISDDCKNLIFRILEVNIKKRATLQQMYDHAWIAFEEKRDGDTEATKMEKMTAENKINLDGVKSTGK